MENIRDTTYDFTLVLRQMYTEDIIRERVEALGATYLPSVQCTDFVVDENAPADADAVTTTFKDVKTGESFKVKRSAAVLFHRKRRTGKLKIVLPSKYLIGADGGRSFVRRHADIPFEGDTSEDKWIRIDGIVETDMPITRAYGYLIPPPASGAYKLRVLTA